MSIKDLPKGPKGFQNERGFRIVETHPDYPEGLGLILVPVVFCASDTHPEPQARFASPHEIARGQLELADRLYAVRVHGTVVIGRREDVAEIAATKVVNHVFPLVGEKLLDLFKHIFELPLIKRVLGKVEGLLK